MKVLHVPFGFYPDTVGGTEVYVATLAHELNRLGVENIIAAPHHEDSEYEYNGLRVLRYANDAHLADLNALYGEGDLLAESSFEKLLTREQPDLVHLHAFTSAISLKTVLVAKRLSTPVVFTYHTPTVTCVRGTLLRWGTEICDGELDERLCTQCLLDNHGLRFPVNAFFAAFPPSLSAMVAGRRHGGAWIAVRMRSLIHKKHKTTLQFLNAVERIVVLCQWTHDLLMRNGIPAVKIYTSPHGLSISNMLVKPKSTLAKHPVKLVFIGRVDPVKGIEFIIRALSELQDSPLELDIFGIVQPGSEQYYEYLIALAINDVRIKFHKPLPYEQIISILQNYHFLVVPSQSLETGPLVVLEAFAAQTPVIGSNIGGIAELVDHGVNGLLVEASFLSAWRETFERVLADSTLYDRLSSGIQPPRTMPIVAQEMFAIYSSLIR